MEVFMRKLFGILLLLAFVGTPVLANTVKQNNYSEELNNEIVNNYVTKKIRVIDEALPGLGDFSKMTNEEYLMAKEQVLKELQSRFAYYNKYYTLKLNDLVKSLERVKTTASTRAAAEQQAIVALHQKNINDMIEERNRVLSLVQDRINKVQNDINTKKNEIK